MILISHSQHYRTYDEYTSELSSGHLSWTPVHESEGFWKENAIKLNGENCEQLKSVTLPQTMNTSSRALVELWSDFWKNPLNRLYSPLLYTILDSMWSTVTRGKSRLYLLQMISFHLWIFPYRLVTDLGGKAKVMELMTHADADVRYRALLSVQQLISQPWAMIWRVFHFPIP